MKRVPAGMRVLSVCAALFGLLLLGLLAAADEPGMALLQLALGRAVLALLAVLAAVSSEALWGARRWAFSASSMLAASFTLAVLMVRYVAGDAWKLADALLFLTTCALFLVPALYYVHDTLGLAQPQPRRRWRRPRPTP